MAIYLSLVFLSHAAMMMIAYWVSAPKRVSAEEEVWFRARLRLLSRRGNLLLIALLFLLLALLAWVTVPAQFNLALHNHPVCLQHDPYARPGCVPPQREWPDFNT